MGLSVQKWDRPGKRDAESRSLTLFNSFRFLIYPLKRVPIPGEDSAEGVSAVSPSPSLIKNTQRERKG